MNPIKFEKEEKRMNLLPKDFSIGLNEVLPNEKFVVKQVSPVYDYEDKKKTDRVIGYRYKLVDPELFETFDVKIEGTTPVVTNEMVADWDNRVYIALENAIIKPYEIKYGKVKYSIIADSIKVLSE